MKEFNLPLTSLKMISLFTYSAVGTPSDSIILIQPKLH